MATPTTAALRSASILIAGLWVMSNAVSAEALGPDRIVRAAEGSRGARGPMRFGADALREIKTSAADSAASSKVVGPGVHETLSIGDHWIYDADVVLYDDFDGDGYFRFVSVRIDADTFFNSSFVYAVIYLSEDGEHFDYFYETKDFEINGASADDEYFVETELVSGYPTGVYDMLIELYDADLGLYVDEFGPAQSSNLELLPLEDVAHDTPPVVVIVEEHGGGGSISWLTLVGLLAAVAASPRRARRTALRAPMLPNSRACATPRRIDLPMS